MTKAEIMDKLTEMEVSFNPRHTKEVLEKLLIDVEKLQELGIDVIQELPEEVEKFEEKSVKQTVYEVVQVAPACFEVWSEGKKELLTRRASEREVEKFINSL